MKPVKITLTNGYEFGFEFTPKMMRDNRPIFERVLAMTHEISDEDVRTPEWLPLFLIQYPELRDDGHLSGSEDDTDVLCTVEFQLYPKGSED